MERNKDELEAQDSAKIEQGVPHTKPAMNQSMKIKPLTAYDSRIVSDIREMFGLDRFAMWAALPSFLVFGYEHVSQALLDARSFSNTITSASRCLIVNHNGTGA